MPITCKIAVLGAGSLGSALVAGLLEAKAVDADNLCATVASAGRAAELARQHTIRVTTGGNAEAASRSDVIVLAVKPAKVRDVLQEIREALRSNQILVSLAAAVPLSRLEQWAPRPMPIFRAMPNLAMSVRESATAISANDEAGDAQRRTVQEIFGAVGTTALVDDEMMHAVTALAGSGPAYVFRIMESLAAGGVKAGLPEDVASSLAQQTVLGAAKLSCKTGRKPARLREDVTTPGGTTIAGLEELEQRGLPAALEAAVLAATRRSRELAEKLLEKRRTRG